MTLLKTGDHIVASNSLYGGTYNLLNVTLPRYGITTTFDRSYTFTVKAEDQFGFSAIERSFTITTTDPDDLLYSNISMVPMLKQTQRTSFRNFIADPNIFTPASIYRPNDPMVKSLLPQAYYIMAVEFNLVGNPSMGRQAFKNELSVNNNHSSWLPGAMAVLVKYYRQKNM